MAWNWRNFMESRLQDREIRDYLDRLTEAQVAAAGQMFLAATSAPFPDLDSVTWVTITQYDATVPAVASEAKGVTLDPVTGGIAFKVPGIWRIDLTFSLTHNENNAGRSMDLVAYNITADSYGNVNRIAIGRNQPGTNFAVNALLQVPEANLNQFFGFRLKMSPGSAVMTGISFTELGYIATYADTFTNLIPN